MRGRIKYMNHEKGFGFIEPADGTKDLFFHATRCRDEFQDLAIDDYVDYNRGEGKKGPCAENVQRA